ncbi:basic proline-rich protein-like [Melopsittacus undulatus]|uniref:basic proline-rich protein-like n=1 Tax=Melopsittacus undulatus TaxID=13146 RepID=UPI00146A03CD|nr:basic proline-rich protein-like [Melopsittacus undulatus]
MAGPSRSGTGERRPRSTGERRPRLCPPRVPPPAFRGGAAPSGLGPPPPPPTPSDRAYKGAPGAGAALPAAAGRAGQGGAGQRRGGQDRAGLGWAGRARPGPPFSSAAAAASPASRGQFVKVPLLPFFALPPPPPYPRSPPPHRRSQPSAAPPVPCGPPGTGRYPRTIIVPSAVVPCRRVSPPPVCRYNIGGLLPPPVRACRGHGCLHRPVCPAPAMPLPGDLPSPPLFIAPSVPRPGAVITAMETRRGHIPHIKRGVPTTTTLNASLCTPKDPPGTVCVTHRAPCV